MEFVKVMEVFVKMCKKFDDCNNCPLLVLEYTTESCSESISIHAKQAEGIIVKWNKEYNKEEAKWKINTTG